MPSMAKTDEKHQQPHTNCNKQLENDNMQCSPNSPTIDKDCCTPPLIFDSTTTTTSLEIFRPESASSSSAVDFYQLPKAPLSCEMIKDPPVVLVPAKGEEYECIEKLVFWMSLKNQALKIA